MQWQPPPEPDAFWGIRAVRRIGRLTERSFWGARPRAQGRPPFATWSAVSEHRFAGLLLVAGFFAVFVDQAMIMYQLVLGAPIFEEMFKFGLALLLAAPIAVKTASGRLAGELARWPLAALIGAGLGAIVATDPLISAQIPDAWQGISTANAALIGAAAFVILTAVARLAAIGLPLGVLGLVRVPLAFAVGAGFGIIEHASTYSDEPLRIFYGRLAFHGGATALSMTLYSIVATLRPVGVRWFALVPSMVLHWLNNASAIFVALISSGIPRLDEVWHLGIIVSIYAVMLVAIPLAIPLRKLAVRAARRRRIVGT